VGPKKRHPGCRGGSRAGRRTASSGEKSSPRLAPWPRLVSPCSRCWSVRCTQARFCCSSMPLGGPSVASEACRPTALSQIAWLALLSRASTPPPPLYTTNYTSTINKEREREREICCL
jgi:hypothetical protein